MRQEKNSGPTTKKSIPSYLPHFNRMTFTYIMNTQYMNWQYRPAIYFDWWRRKITETSGIKKGKLAIWKLKLIDINEKNKQMNKLIPRNHFKFYGVISMQLILLAKENTTFIFLLRVKMEKKNPFPPFFDIIFQKPINCSMMAEMKKRTRVFYVSSALGAENVWLNLFRF